MSPPTGVCSSQSANANQPTTCTPAEERGEFLTIDQFLVDPSNSADPQHHIKKWKSDRDYRLGHQKINDIIDYVGRFIKRDSSIPPSKLESFLKEWSQDPKFNEDPLNAVVLANLRRVLGQFQTDSNKEPAQAVSKMLPPPPEEPKPEAPAKPKADEKKAPVELNADPKKNWALGLELHNDSGTLAVLDFVGIPLSSFAAEKNHITVRPTLDFPMGSWVGTLRLNGGVFEGRGIPGENGGKGLGYRFGVDFGLVNPYSDSHERSGVGIEVTGVATHAGQATGIDAPSPIARLHIWRQSDLNFRLGGNFELGINTFLNNQETYVNLGKGDQLAGPGGASPLATASDLFARNPFRWLGVSGRYYFNGTPDRETAEDLSKPFRPGEGAPKIGNLWTGMIINMNRREDIPAFSNTSVLMGTFWPLGMEGSMSQFDTISTGLTFYSLQDGYFMAKNAQTRGEIWRRDDSWVLRGLMLGGDAAMLGYNIYRVATAKADPPTNQTMQEFIDNPGSVTDFSGRAGRINLALQGVELGWSALDASGVAGNVYDEDRTRFWATSGVATGLGLLGFLFSGAITGNGCASDGPGGSSVLLRCGFPAQREKYFKSGINATPDNMESIENQYIFSSFSGMVASWGLTRMIMPLTLSVKPSGSGESKSAAKNTAVTAPYVNVNIGNGGANLMVGGQF